MTEMENVYNLVLGDVGEDGEIDDLSVSDNGDRNKVRMAIGLHLEELSVKFEICTFMEKQLVPFCKNMNVKGFVVKRKNV